jgi:hypothetical protein
MQSALSRMRLHYISYLLHLENRDPMPIQTNHLQEKI